MKIRPVEADMFHANGQIDTAKLQLLFFRNFTKAPKKGSRVVTVTTDSKLHWGIHPFRGRSFLKTLSTPLW